jgi:peptide deformylase
VPLREILTHPDPVLRQRARPVLRLTDAIRRLIADMIQTMQAAPGIGLAAPQVGESLRLFVYDIGDGPGAIINPEIVDRAGDEIGVEGCLSIPRLEGEVPRAQMVEVTGLDRHGKRLRLRAEDMLARVFQHEIDHLDGVLFTDRADPATLHWLTDEEEDDRKHRRGARRAARSADGAAARG